MVRHCIYAVDKNPLAVDLCKVALWIECHNPGRPLGFLDHHVKCGDSLVGVMDLDVLDEGIPDDAYKAVTGDDKKAAAWYRKRNKRERTTGQRSLTLESSSMDTAVLAGDYETFGELEEHTADEVKAMEELYGDMRGSGTSWWQLKTACDLWTYAFFAPLRTAGPGEPDLVPTTDHVRSVLDSGSRGTQLEEDALQASRTHPYFHWPLEFPDVFENGGFNVVLGNPPWERIKLQEKEFFYGRDEEIINAPNKAARERLIRALEITNPGLLYEFHQAKHSAESVSRFVRESARFPLTGRGDINTYPVFTETARYLLAPSGRLGIIVPTGIATDNTTKDLFYNLVKTKSLVSLYDFENRKKVFPGIDSRLKFCLLTISGIDRPSANAEFAFYLHSTEHLQESERRFELSAEDFDLFNPNTRTCPTFRSHKDMEIARKIYLQAGILWKEATPAEPEVNPWNIVFQSMFHMSNDSRLFYTYTELQATGWQLEGNIFIRDKEQHLPLYEAKLFHQYDHRFATFIKSNFEDISKVKTRYITSEEKLNPNALPLPRYWVSDKDALDKIKIQKANDSRIQESKNPRIQESKNPRIQESKNPRIQESKNPRIQESKNPRIQESKNPRIQESKNPMYYIALRVIVRATDQRTINSALVPLSGLGQGMAIQLGESP